MHKKVEKKYLRILSFLFPLAAVSRTPISDTYSALSRAFRFLVFQSPPSLGFNYRAEFMAETSRCKSLSSHRQGSHRLMRFGPLPPGLLQLYDISFGCGSAQSMGKKGGQAGDLLVLLSTPLHTMVHQFSVRFGAADAAVASLAASD